MRLTQNEIKIIKTNILSYIRDAQIILFGSRIYDDKRGGDIDIFVKTAQKINLADQIKILANLEMSGILRKVDMIIKDPATKDQPIFETIEKEGILL